MGRDEVPIDRKELHDLAEAMATGFADLAALPPEEYRVGLEGIRLLVATAEPVAPDQIAASVGSSTKRVNEILGGFATDSVSAYLDDHGRVLAMWGVTVPGTKIPATRHRFDVDGRTVYTWCAIDTLFLVDYVHFFASQQAARAWAERSEGTYVPRSPRASSTDASTTTRSWARRSRRMAHDRSGPPAIQIKSFESDPKEKP